MSTLQNVSASAAPCHNGKYLATEKGVRPRWNRYVPLWCCICNGEIFAKQCMANRQRHKYNVTVNLCAAMPNGTHITYGMTVCGRHTTCHKPSAHTNNYIQGANAYLHKCMWATVNASKVWLDVIVCMICFVACNRPYFSATRYAMSHELGAFLSSRMQIQTNKTKRRNM